MQSISNIIIKKTAKWAKPLLRLTAALIALTFFCPPALATTMDDILSLAMISVKTQYINPLQAEEREFQSLTALVYEGLFSLDDDYMPQLCLASSCDSTTDGKSWTVRIRPNVYFHDGQPCTAYDVEATINEILRLAEEELRSEAYNTTLSQLTDGLEGKRTWMWRYVITG